MTLTDDDIYFDVDPATASGTDDDSSSRASSNLQIATPVVTTATKASRHEIRNGNLRRRKYGFCPLALFRKAKRKLSWNNNKTNTTHHVKSQGSKEFEFATFDEIYEISY